MEFQREIEGFGDALVGDVVVGRTNSCTDISSVIFITDVMVSSDNNVSVTSTGLSYPLM